jgi:hypothetical protein
MRDAIELGERPLERATEWLSAAARFEREVQRDALAAERHLALAVRLAPRSSELGEAYREVAALVAARARRQREAADDTGEIEAPDAGRDEG